MTSATSTTTPPSQSQQQPRTTSSVLYLARPLSQSYLSDNTDFEMVEHETDPFMPAATSSPPPPSSASSASAAAVAAAAIAYQQQQHQQHQHQQQQHEQQHQEAIAAPLAPPTAPPPHPPMPDPTTTSTSSHRTMTPTPTPMALLDQLDPEVSAQVREVGWSLLERFSHVTQATRATAARLLDHPLSQPLMPVLPRNVQALSSTYRAEDHPGAPLEEMARELPAAGAYLARWVSGAAAASVTVGKGEGRSSTEVWEDDSDEESDLGGFGVISTASSMPKPVSKRSPAKMLSAEMWIQYESSGFRQSIPIDGNDTTEDVGADDPDANRDLDISAIVAQVKERIFLGGIDRDVRPQVYKYLLGVLPWGATPDEREAIMRDKSAAYDALVERWSGFSSATLSATEWETWYDWRHRIVKDVIRTDRHHPFYAAPTVASFPVGSAAAQAAAAAMVAAKAADSDHDDEDDSLASNQDEEDVLMNGVRGSGDAALAAACDPRYVNRNLGKLTRVLASYVAYLEDVGRAELGYVQGMSDLGSVFLLLHDGNEVDTFWCFVGFMERVHTNFHMNQQAMHRQLTTLRSLVQFIDYPLFKHLAKCDALNMFFAFRWLLIWFKREYSMPDVLRLWDVCLSDARSPDYQLFVALAMLETARADVMGTCTAFDSILKLANEMSDNVPAEPVLEEAEMLFAVFENKLRAAQARVHAQAIAGGEDGVEPVVPGTFPKIGSLDLELSKSLAGLATRMPPPVPYHDSRPGTPA